MNELKSDGTFFLDVPADHPPGLGNGKRQGLGSGTRHGKYVTANFVVEAPTKEIARTIGQRAEADRERLASFWLGHEAPAWHERCLGTGWQTPVVGLRYQSCLPR